MKDRRDARDYPAARLRDEADELLEHTRREVDPDTKREMIERAELLERTAEMLEMAAIEPAP
jgi:hypothetical protein